MAICTLYRNLFNLAHYFRYAVGNICIFYSLVPPLLV